MSKSKNHKWYYDDYDRGQEDRKHKGKERSRRDQKKMKSALRSKDIDTLTEMDD